MQLDKIIRVCASAMEAHGQQHCVDVVVGQHAYCARYG